MSISPDPRRGWFENWRVNGGKYKDKIWPEKLTAGYFEIEVEYVFPYSTIPSLHEEFMTMAQMAVEGYRIGKEVVGEEFCK